MFASDQGFHLGWRGQWHKHTSSEQVLRVPLIVRLPQGVREAKANGIVERLDGSRELYDHSTDAAEYYNVIDRPEHEPLVKRLHALLEKEFVGPAAGGGAWQKSSVQGRLSMNPRQS